MSSFDGEATSGPGALDWFFRSRYREIRDAAAAILRRERLDHTLQATALVHEAWLRLAKRESLDCSDPVALRSLVAVVVRHVLVDHARARNGPQRGEGWRRVMMREAATHEAGESMSVDLLDLDEAIDALAAINPRQARVVELRLFGGLTHSEVAERLEVSEGTIELDWKLARHWLRSRLEEGAA